MLKIFRLEKDNIDNALQRLNKRNQTDDKKVWSIVSDIVDDVKNNGNSALIKYTKKFDKVELQEENLFVKQELIDGSERLINKALKEAIDIAAKNIREYHELQKQETWKVEKEEGVILGQLINPIETVGVYVPGGTAPLFSSVLMTAIPANVAGVKNIIMSTPPNAKGEINVAMLYAAKIAGVSKILKAGGAQAIAALTYGTRTIDKVDKIVGPGNIYVSTAKRMVYGICDIDMFAGPSEIAIIADKYANPEYIAADILSQAEHDILAACILVCTDEELCKKAFSCLEKQLNKLSRKDIALKSIQDFGTCVIVKDIEQAIDVINKIAPEHLELYIKEPFSVLNMIKNAGAVFLGESTPEPIGDYFAGPNHVLPTGGTARFYSPLGVYDYVKRTSIISYSSSALKRNGEYIVEMAKAEGLDAHANAVKIRLKDNK